MPRKRLQNVTDRIYEALCTLVLDKHRDYNELSIQDIVNQAEVCRNSFYRNYVTKDDILIKKFSELYPLDNPTSPVTPPLSLDDFLYGLFRDIQKNRRFFRTFYLSIPVLYYETLSKHVIQSNMRPDTETLSTEDYYRFACKAWMAVGITTEWIQRDCDASIESLCTLLKNFSLQ